jgi:hypothetical protein
MIPSGRAKCLRSRILRGRTAAQPKRDAATAQSQPAQPGEAEFVVCESTIYADEVEGRWVTLKVYESEDAEEEDADPVVRVTEAPIEDVEQNEDGQKLVAETDADDKSITLDPDAVEDLEEELIEIGFSPAAAAWIVSKVPV